MPNFKSAADQAKQRTRSKVKHGFSRKNGTNFSGACISSVATEKKYEGNVRRFIEYLQLERVYVDAATPKNVEQFLESMCDCCTQKTLDGYRQAIHVVFGIHAEYVLSRKPTLQLPRAYRLEQIEMLCSNASPILSLSIRVAYYAGLRSIELDTISKPDDMREDHRSWLDERFIGRENIKRYVVHGKGGLRRAVCLSQRLSDEIEQTRLSAVTIKRQREINYTKRYALLGTHSFSLQFSRLSQKVLGWSTGGHGLRHAYAQARMGELQRLGYAWGDALKIIAQEMGHFSTKNTLTYFR